MTLRQEEGCTVQAIDTPHGVCYGSRTMDFRLIGILSDSAPVARHAGESRHIFSDSYFPDCGFRGNHPCKRLHPVG